jgi:hypothetical protein
MTMKTKTAPQSCYPEEIETLREMLAEESENAHGHVSDMIEDRTFDRSKMIAMHLRRIEALRTAIEALGGAL